MLRRNDGSESRLGLIPITKTSTGPLDYAYDLSKAIQFPGAHGEEIVRDLFTDVHVSHASFITWPLMTLLRHEQHTRAAKTGIFALGSYPRTRVWRLMTRLNPRRRRKRAAIGKRRGRIRRIRKRVMRRGSSLIELSEEGVWKSERSRCSKYILRSTQQEYGLRLVQNKTGDAMLPKDSRACSPSMFEIPTNLQRSSTPSATLVI
jgi:hypothetical protein